MLRQDSYCHVVPFHCSLPEITHLQKFQETRIINVFLGDDVIKALHGYIVYCPVQNVLKTSQCPVHFVFCILLC